MTMTSDERAPELDDAAEPEQPALLELDLPDHHGRRPNGMRTKLNGAGNRVAQSHTIGDRVVLVVEATVKDAGHTRTEKDGLLYTEKLVVDDAFEVDPESASALLAGLRQQYRIADDSRHGRVALFGNERRAVTPKIVWADETGYILDDADLAVLRGEEVPPSAEELEQAERAAMAAEAAEDAAAAADLEAPRWLRAVEDGDAVGFDKLTVEQIRSSLPYVESLAGVFALQTYEAANKNRKAVRALLEARAAELSE